MKRFNFAFTLAEVLITLGIIGVVAAITMPTLISYHQKTVTVTALKKMYSQLTNAAKMYQAQNGITFEEFDTSLGSNTFMQTYILPYMQVIDECDNIAECYGNSKPLAVNRTSEITTVGGHIFVLKDGSFLAADASLVSGVLFFFDLNGAKAPNISGRDIFYFYLINNSTMNNNKIVSDLPACTDILRYKSGLYPGGYSGCLFPFTHYSTNSLLGTSIDRSCNRNSPQVVPTGADACAAAIMLNGWKIPDNYPW